MLLSATANVRNNSLLRVFRYAEMIWRTGLPTRISLPAWSWEKLITGMELGETINVHADGYLYGEGGGYTARPEEVGYLTMRLASKPTFLKDRCRKVVSVDFKLLSAIKA